VVKDSGGNVGEGKTQRGWGGGKQVTGKRSIGNPARENKSSDEPLKIITTGCGGTKGTVQPGRENPEFSIHERCEFAGKIKRWRLG